MKKIHIHFFYSAMTAFLTFVGFNAIGQSVPSAMSAPTIIQLNPPILQDNTIQATSPDDPAVPIFETWMRAPGVIVVGIYNQDLHFTELPRITIRRITGPDSYNISLNTSGINLWIRHDPVARTDYTLGTLWTTSVRDDVLTELKKKLQGDFQLAKTNAWKEIQQLTPLEVARRRAIATLETIRNAPNDIVAIEEAVFANVGLESQSLVSSDKGWNDPRAVVAKWGKMTLYCWPTDRAESMDNPSVPVFRYTLDGFDERGQNIFLGKIDRKTGQYTSSREILEKVLTATVQK